MNAQHLNATYDHEVDEKDTAMHTARKRIAHSLATCGDTQDPAAGRISHHSRLKVEVGAQEVIGDGRRQTVGHFELALLRQYACHRLRT